MKMCKQSFNISKHANTTNPCIVLDVSDVFLQSIFKLNDEKKLSYKYYNKRIKTRDNGKVQSHDKEESKLNSTITANSGAHTLTHDQIIKKGPYNKNNVATIKMNKILAKILLLGLVE